MNVCVVGHGMMGAWHSRALADAGCTLHTLVGRRPDPTREFAAGAGFRGWTTDLEAALRDDEVDLVVLANPSEQHAPAAKAALRSDKHVLVEIPIAMTAVDAEELVEVAAVRGLTLGAVHPFRARPELVALHRRVEAGEERLYHVAGRFFIHRRENVGATGYRRSWSDNLLWHHMAHLVDAGLWLLGLPLVRVEGLMPPADPDTGIPMEVSLVGENERAQSLVCSGSYNGRERIFEVLVVTDRESYRLDVFRSTITVGEVSTPVAGEEANCAVLTRDFAEAVRAGREPLVPAAAVLSAMRVLQEVQDAWDRSYGRRALPGRPLA